MSAEHSLDIRRLIDYHQPAWEMNESGAEGILINITLWDLISRHNIHRMMG